MSIVCKFGGSSTADAACFRQILRILDASGARRCAVLSAPGASEECGWKVTDLLQRSWDLRQRPIEAEAALSQVADRYAQIARDLGVPPRSGETRRCLLGALRVSREHLLSRGEALCASLFSRWSGIPMADSADVVAFDERGMLDEPRTRQNFSALAERYDRVILPGFYGAGPGGEIRVFPRNGSDITGALAAAGMQAALYENWTDVPGLMTADPALVPHARRIPHVSYRQMRALARFGARVLHPDCLDPVCEAGIPTRLRPTRTPDQFGTLISDSCADPVPCVTGAPKEDGSVQICAFSSDRRARRAAAKAAGAIHMEDRGDCALFCVPREGWTDALRRAHDCVVCPTFRE